MNIELLEVRDLRYFLAVHRHGRLTRAAAELGVAQPTLSHAMHRLEQALGHALWHRPASRRNPLRATQVGELLRRHALRLLGEVEHLREEVDALGDLRRGRLALGCIPSLMAGLLPRTLAQLRSRHPGLAISVQTVRSESWRQPLDQGEVDAVLVADAGENLAGYSVRPCGHQRFVAVLRADHPLAGETSLPLKRLQREALLLVPLATVTGGLIARACQQAGFSAAPVLTLDSPEGLRELVRLGSGITILPEGYVAPGDPDLRCLPIERPVLRRPVVMIHQSTLETQPALDVFYQVLRG